MREQHRDPGDGTLRPVPRGRRLAGALAGIAVLAGCTNSGGGAVAVSPPTPAASVAADCASFIRALPADLVQGQSPRRTTPSSPYTAAFGDPAVTVRCGVPVPSHDPTSLIEEFNNVDWLDLPAGDAQRYVSYTSRLVVEVVIPHAYLPVNVLLGIPQHLLGAPPPSS